MRGQERKVLEIHLEAFGITYTRQTTQRMYAGTGSAHPHPTVNNLTTRNS
ncbi:hypothetical protein [Amycolatopsis aidingensis]|nr:hypothetical protein [Amycolatopsis aidingensis]